MVYPEQRETEDFNRKTTNNNQEKNYENIQ